MPRDGSGTYSQPVSSVSPAVTATTISSNDFNSLMTDISTEITDSFDRSGKGAMLAALAMGGFKITNLAVPTVASDAARFDTVTGFALTGDVTGTPGANVVSTVSGNKVTGLAAGAFPSAGKVGEVLVSAASVAVSSGATSNITSLALTAGNWLIFGFIGTGPGGGTSTQFFQGAISLTSSSLTSVNVATHVIVPFPTAIAAGVIYATGLPSCVQTISTNTTYFLTTNIIFSGGTMNAGGRITAIRLD